MHYTFVLGMTDSFGISAFLTQFIKVITGPFALLFGIIAVLAGAWAIWQGREGHEGLQKLGMIGVAVGLLASAGRIWDMFATAGGGQSVAQIEGITIEQAPAARPAPALLVLVSRTASGTVLQGCGRTVVVHQRESKQSAAQGVARSANPPQHHRRYRHHRYGHHPCAAPSAKPQNNA